MSNSADLRLLHSDNMENESDTVQLFEYNGKRNPRTGRKRRRRTRNESSGMMSDSELGRSLSDQEHGGNGPFSDYGESLPSIRAQEANMRCQESRDHKETTPLLVDSAIGTDERAPQEVDRKERDESSGYDSIAMSPDKSKSEKTAKIQKWYKILKVVFLTSFIVACVILFAINDELEAGYTILSVDGGDSKALNYGKGEGATELSGWHFATINLVGPFEDKQYHSNLSNRSDGSEHLPCSHFLFLCGTQWDSLPPDCPGAEDDVGGNHTGNHTKHNCESVLIVPEANSSHPATIIRTLDILKEEKGNFSVVFTNNSTGNVAFQATIIGEKISKTSQVIISFVILVGVYILIGFDIVHRTIAAILGSTCTLGVLSMLGKRPTLYDVVEWIDLDTICLLFGMMTLVAIFAQTGFFDYSAVKAYKMARGKIWPLISLLCIFSAVVSAFLDNVTTILLLTPVSIRLCQVLNLDPRPVLIAEVVFSNIGGTATAIGDPPNVIIVSNSLIREAGIDFAEFTLHLFIGILFCIVVAYILLAVIYKLNQIGGTNKDAPHISELKREVTIWERTAAQVGTVSLEERAVREALVAKALEVRQQLKEQVSVTMKSAKEIWQKNLAVLESKYRITDKVLLAKSTAVLAVVILLFFLSNTIPKVELELGWIAIFGGVVLLILSDVQDLESVLHKIEWGTLLFFAALFILMEGLGELGLIRFIGDIMVYVVNRVDLEHQMTVAIILVVWVSAIASSFIDNIPFTTATIPVIVELADSAEVCLSLRPLVWALAFGACLGGNGTLIGASANVVCAGIAEQNGYKISFIAFFKIGFVMMLVTTLTAMVYLLVCHSGLHWNTGEARECVAARLAPAS